MNKLQMFIIIGAIVFALIAVLILLGALPGLQNSADNQGAALAMWGFDEELKFQEIFPAYS